MILNLIKVYLIFSNIEFSGLYGGIFPTLNKTEIFLCWSLVKVIIITF